MLFFGALARVMFFDVKALELVLNIRVILFFLKRCAGFISKMGLVFQDVFQQS